jgi:hypothetical protein
VRLLYVSPDSSLVAKVVVESTVKYGLQHPAHSPVLVPSDFYLFGPFKNFQSEKQFKGQTALQKTVVQYFIFPGQEYPHEQCLNL